MPLTMKYAYATEENWKDIAERKLYAQLLRKVIATRGRTTVMRIVDGVVSEVEISTLTDADLTPENGYHYFDHCPPVSGTLKKHEGQLCKVIDFNTDKHGQEWACIRTTWSAPTCLPASLFPDAATAEAMGGVSTYDGEMYSFKSYDFDFSDVVNSYSWDVIQDTVPELVVETL